MPARRTTLQDVARELNVSPSLVSKVLNRRLSGRSGASREKVQAIFDKARELDYQRNAIATSLVKGRQDAMAVYVHEHGVEGSEITSRTFKGVAEQAARLQQRLMLQYYSNAEEFHQLAESAHQSVFDGLILIGLAMRVPSESVQSLLRRHMPVVTVYDHEINPEFPNMGMDQQEVGRLATQHLIERGCRQIGFIGVQTGVHRLQGYRQALEQAGLPYDERLVAQRSGYTAGTGEAAVQAWRANQVAFDGVVGQSDQHAAGVINALMRVGVRVPDEVKVVGVDDSPFCGFYPVPITSVSQETGRRGAMAAEALYHLIRREPAPSVVIPPRLVVRASSGG